MDPIRPFADLIRSLRASRKQATQNRPLEGGTSDSPRDIEASASAAAPQPLEHALRGRLPAVAQWDERRAREIFVEHALSRELDAGLATDPAFADLVANVSELIAQQPHISARLDTLLRSIAGR